MNNYKIIGKSVLAGIFIGIASMLSNNIIATTGFIFIPAILFSIGLISVLKFKSYLYTGKVGYISRWKDLYYLAIIFFFNCLPCLAFLAFTIPGMAAPVFLSQSFISLLIKGIICGMFIYMAVYMWNDPSNKTPICTTIICVSSFILCGSRHCIADFASLCLFASFSNPITLIAIVKILIIAIGNGLGSIFLHQLNKHKYLI